MRGGGLTPPRAPPSLPSPSSLLAAASAPPASSSAYDWLRGSDVRVSMTYQGGWGAGEEGVARERGAVTPSVTAAVSARGLDAPATDCGGRSGLTAAGGRGRPPPGAPPEPPPSLRSSRAWELGWRAWKIERSWLPQVKADHSSADI